MGSLVIRDGGGDYERPEIGLHRAVCTHVVDLGLQNTQFGAKHKVAVVFEIDQEMSKGDNAGKPFMVCKLYTASTNKKASLRQHLDSWRGRPMTELEAAAFDLMKVVGAPATLNLTENTANDKTYTNINAVLPAQKGVPVLTASGQPYPSWIDDTMRKAVTEEQAEQINEAPAALVVDDSGDGLPF